MVAKRARRTTAPGNKVRTMILSPPPPRRWKQMQSHCRAWPHPVRSTVHAAPHDGGAGPGQEYRGLSCGSETFSASTSVKSHTVRESISGTTSRGLVCWRKKLSYLFNARAHSNSTENTSMSLCICELSGWQGFQDGLWTTLNSLLTFSLWVTQLPLNSQYSAICTFPRQIRCYCGSSTPHSAHLTSLLATKLKTWSYHDLKKHKLLLARMGFLFVDCQKNFSVHGHGCQAQDAKQVRPIRTSRMVICL